MYNMYPLLQIGKWACGMIFFQGAADSYQNTFNCGEITNVGYPFWGAGQAGACGNPHISSVR
ncbi:hypothetical protein CFP56_014261 [Quercus suber]|uniref:Uncharacterized protein n=1 Tax=Quercus suber TaxID=58331 RepID=A0AAW0KUI7_QUESU